MDKEQEFFETLGGSLCDQNNISFGKMMSCPALTYNNKVFAFYSKKSMVFRVGKDFEPKKNNIKKWSYLSPFKHKPPMKGWIVVSFSDHKKWKQLALRSLALLQKN